MRDTGRRNVFTGQFYHSFVRRSVSDDYSHRSVDNDVGSVTNGGEQQGTDGIEEGVYVISVAARLLHVHPQTLRKYERVGLVVPNRSMGMLRLYSAEDIVRLRLIKYMVDDLRMNLAGVEFALNFLNKVMGLRQMIRDMALTNDAHALLAEEMEQIFRDFGVSFSDSQNVS